MRTFAGVALGLLLAATACGKPAAKATRRAYVTTRDSTVLLPLSLRSVIAEVPGVESVVPEIPIQWPDGDKIVWGIAVDAEELTKRQPAVLGLTEEDAARWVRDAEGVVISRSLAARRGWGLGDSVAFNLSTRSAERAAAAEVDRFGVRGIYDAPGEQFAIHLAHYRRLSGPADDTVPLFVLAIAPPYKKVVDDLTSALAGKAPHARVEMPESGRVDAPR